MRTNMKTLLPVLTAIAILAPTHANSQEVNTVDPQVASDDLPNTFAGWRTTILGSFYRQDYEEPDFMREKGSMFQLGLQRSYKGSRSLFRLGLIMSRGTVRYDGGITNGDGTTEPLVVEGIKDTRIDGKLIFGKVFRPQSDRFTIAPYAGFGLRRLSDDLSSSTGGYLRISSYTYVPVGFEIELKSGNNKRAVRISAEYDHLVQGRQASKLSGLDQNNFIIPDLHNKQGTGHGMKFSLINDFYTGTSNVRGNSPFFSIEGYVQLWDIEDSDTVLVIVRERSTNNLYGLYALEPANTTFEWGIRISYSFGRKDKQAVDPVVGQSRRESRRTLTDAEPSPRKSLPINAILQHFVSWRSPFWPDNAR